MKIKYKIDVMQALAAAGYTQYVIQKKNLLSSSTITKIRRGEGIGWDNLQRLCTLLEMQPGDIIEAVPNND